MKVVVETRGVKMTVEWDQDVPEAAISIQKFADAVLPQVAPAFEALSVLGQQLFERVERLEQIERGTLPRSA